MKPIPVAFHIGPLEVHTYGIGLALTFWFAFTYFERRLRQERVPTDWFVASSCGSFWLPSSGAGAPRGLEPRLLHPQPGPGVGHLARRPLVVRWPALRGARPASSSPGVAVPNSARTALDLVAPVLMAAWAMGRCSGPSSWWPGAGTRPISGSACTTPVRAGRRLPVPLFQAPRTSASTRPDRHRAATEPVARRIGRTGYPSGASSGRPWCSGASSGRSTSTLARRGRASRFVLVQMAGVLLVVGGTVVLSGPAGAGRSGDRRIGAQAGACTAVPRRCGPSPEATAPTKRSSAPPVSTQLL